MKVRPILAWVVLAGLFGGCADDSLLDPLARAPVVGAQSTAAVNQNLLVTGASLAAQPYAVRLTVPVVDPADILSATFYWALRAPSEAGDDTVLIDGVPHQGTLVFSQDGGGNDPWVLIYKLDVTGVVQPGAGTYLVSGLSAGGQRPGGLTAAVLYRDPTSPYARIRIVEPWELVRWDLPGQQRGAVWSFPIAPAAQNELAKLWVATADCESQRPDRIFYAAGPGPAPSDLSGAPGVFTNLLRAAYGSHADVLIRPNLIVPTGSEYFAYQIESPPGGDSIIHLFGAVGITGDVPPCEAAIGDLVWNDQDGDGTQGPGEPGIAGAAVTLLDASGAVAAQTVTDAAGFYEFSGLCPGDWSVEVATPDGFEASPCDAGPDDVDGECSPAAVTLASETDRAMGVDFGFKAIPPPPVAGCFLSATDWWREMSRHCRGDRDDHRRFTPDELTALLADAVAATSLDLTHGDRQLTPKRAALLLRKGHRRSSCHEAHRQCLAALLNYAASGSDPRIPVDTNGDGSPDLSFGEAIDAMEALMQGREDRSACRAAAALGESINRTPGPECGS
jgi:hypothetical protein